MVDVEGKPEYVYTGAINDEGDRWHDVDEIQRIDGLEWIRRTVTELCKGTTQPL
jgi:hypothetical protein